MRLGPWRLSISIRFRRNLYRWRISNGTNFIKTHRYRQKYNFFLYRSVFDELYRWKLNGTNFIKNVSLSKKVMTKPSQRQGGFREVSRIREFSRLENPENHRESLGILGKKKHQNDHSFSICIRFWRDLCRWKALSALHRYKFRRKRFYIEIHIPDVQICHRTITHSECNAVSIAP